MATALTDRAMTCNLSIGIWAGYRLDRDASRKVTEDAGANADAARVNKHLVPKDALAPIVTAQNAIRTHFYTKTLPWRDNGDRVLTKKLFLDFIPEHERLVAVFNEAVDKFLGEDYPSVIAKAEFRMGAMFDRADYPSPGQLRQRFYANLDIDAITTANDFRVQIDQAHVDKVRASMEAAAEQRLKAATADVWRRMAETVGYFQARMADPKAVFRDSTVTNIGEMLDLVPGLNVLDDPDIEQVRGAIAKALGGIDAKDIRKDPDLRAELAGEAKQIMDTMAGFMQAFGGGSGVMGAETETLQRVRRIETRLTQLLIAQGIDTAKQKPVFDPGSVAHNAQATIRLPSPHTSVKELLTAVPDGWSGTIQVNVGCETIGILTLDRT